MSPSSCRPAGVDRAVGDPNTVSVTPLLHTLGMDEGLRIDCDECVAQHTDACDDCVVSFILGREPDDAVVVDVNEIRALKLLGNADLVPPLRHRPRTGTA